MAGQTDESRIVESLELLNAAIMALIAGNQTIAKAMSDQATAEIRKIRVRHDQPLKEERADLRREQGGPS